MKHSVSLKKVAAAFCDGDLLILNFFLTHFGLTDDDELNADTDVVYRARIFLNDDKCYVYLISDQSDLHKTAHNCLNNYGFGKYTRFMWNGGLFLIWNHINDISLEDQE